MGLTSTRLNSSFPAAYLSQMQLPLTRKRNSGGQGPGGNHNPPLAFPASILNVDGSNTIGTTRRLRPLLSELLAMSPLLIPAAEIF